MDDAQMPPHDDLARYAKLPVAEIQELFAQHWPDETWSETLRRICGMVNAADAETLIGFLTQKAHPDWRRQFRIQPPTHLGLAVQCLAT